MLEGCRRRCIGVCILAGVCFGWCSICVRLALVCGVFMFVGLFVSLLLQFISLSNYGEARCDLISLYISTTPTSSGKDFLAEKNVHSEVGLDLDNYQPDHLLIYLSSVPLQLPVYLDSYHFPTKLSFLHRTILCREDSCHLRPFCLLLL